ncbi:uncharacterized protein LOC111903739 [Lactuca sativa]|uniref:Uncharacterized protein n=1 Tax=Lactuca sativa TaxID=4236 RepID=A0A9R1UWH7_LACSA|nr:uncharacterized protein LOC111903739 [Lactuca sativa]KAJ0194145.1 hypothetical protein LSAT_V11C800440440 [Lactuca sativa]
MDTNLLEWIKTLLDSLRQIQKGASSVTCHLSIGRKFKVTCDPIDDSDQAHYLLCSLGAAYESFSTSHSVVTPYPTFRVLLSQEECHKLFMSSLYGPVSPQPLSMLSLTMFHLTNYLEGHLKARTSPLKLLRGMRMWQETTPFLALKKERALCLNVSRCLHLSTRCFAIQNRITKEIISMGRCEDGLYMLSKEIRHFWPI